MEGAGGGGGQPQARKGASKYDFVKVTVRLEEHQYIFSRYLISRMLMVAQIPWKRAVRMSLALKKQLVDSFALKIEHSQMEEKLFDIMRASKYSEEYVQRYLRISRFYYHRTPLIVLLFGTEGIGKSTLATHLAERLNMPHVLQTKIVFEVLTSTNSELKGLLHGCGGDDLRLDAFLRECAFVHQGMSREVQKVIREGKSAIVEGMHIYLPAFFDQIAEATLAERQRLAEKREAQWHREVKRKRRSAGRSGSSGRKGGSGSPRAEREEDCGVLRHVEFAPDVNAGNGRMARGCGGEFSEIADDSAVAFAELDLVRRALARRCLQEDGSERDEWGAVSLPDRATAQIEDDVDLDVSLAVLPPSIPEVGLLADAEAERRSSGNEGEDEGEEEDDDDDEDDDEVGAAARGREGGIAAVALGEGDGRGVESTGHPEEDAGTEGEVGTGGEEEDDTDEDGDNMARSLPSSGLKRFLVGRRSVTKVLSSSLPQGSPLQRSRSASSHPLPIERLPAAQKRGTSPDPSVSPVSPPRSGEQMGGRGDAAGAARRCRRGGARRLDTNTVPIVVPFFLHMNEADHRVLFMRAYRRVPLDAVDGSDRSDSAPVAEEAEEAAQQHERVFRNLRRLQEFFAASVANLRAEADAAEDGVPLDAATDAERAIHQERLRLCASVECMELSLADGFEGTLRAIHESVLHRIFENQDMWGDVDG